MASPEGSRGFRQMRHDLDDVYALLDTTNTAVSSISATQRRHTNRLEEVQQSLDLQSGRMDRVEDNQRQQGERLGRVEGRLGGVEGRLGGVEGRLERIEQLQAQILDLLRADPGE